jgi:hypothetical protein
MDVIVHIGAHRCATTSFQNYLRLNSDRLSEQGVGFWGPYRTRAGLFRGILPGPYVATGRDLHRRAIGRVQMHLARSAGLGLRTLLVSDENMAGTMRENLRMGELYCGIGERLARYGGAFDGRIRHVVLNIRSLDTYWASALGFGLTRGRGLPSRAQLHRLANSPRCWRDVITDVACALPNATIWALPFEVFAGRPEAQLAAIARISPPKNHARDWLNPTPRLPRLRALAADLGENWPLPEGDGRWQPFAPPQAAMLREAYADDLMWLTGGADGLARLMPDPDKTSDSGKIQAGLNPPRPDMTRGRHDDQQERRVARAR